MNFILLFSIVTGLNFADSIYSATFFLSKAISIYPLFPLIDEIAFYNQDKTLDYSTLIDGAENKYDAINAYETLLYMNIPQVMTEYRGMHGPDPDNIRNGSSRKSEA